MLQYLVNLYIGNGVFKGGVDKVKKQGNMGEEFENTFNVNPSQMKAAGLFEAIGASFLFLSFFGKTFTRIGTLMVALVMGPAAFKHLKAGHGMEGSKHAGTLLGLSLVSFLETFKKK